MRAHWIYLDKVLSMRTNNINSHEYQQYIFWCKKTHKKMQKKQTNKNNNKDPKLLPQINALSGTVWYMQYVKQTAQVNSNIPHLLVYQLQAEYWTIIYGPFQTNCLKTFRSSCKMRTFRSSCKMRIFRSSCACIKKGPNENVKSSLIFMGRTWLVCPLILPLTHSRLNSPTLYIWRVQLQF